MKLVWLKSQYFVSIQELKRYSFSHLFHIGLTVNGGSDWLNVLQLQLTNFLYF